MSDNFEQFYQDLKKVEEKDSVLTSDQQITRLLKPGSTYLNLNPFEVLQIDSDCTIEEAKKRYKRLSILVHPDKNPDDRERAQRAFDILKRAITKLENPDELARCKEVYTEARARLAIVMSEKKRKLRKDGKSEEIDEDTEDGYRKALWVTVTKVFADREKKRRAIEERQREEKRRTAEELQKAQEKRKLEEEYKQNYESTRDLRRGSWREFMKKKEKKLATYQGANFRPVTGKLETSKQQPSQPTRRF
ncbi:unnamed protein product [Bursaphelenchus okinawaensis]|uniref:J domain-containing protein n=1 Tax=Bursaphelenchus okinawaensis TaxID=465554 RepID=A0A811L628_9BILA|nr:unnamed protein product [Bursaphelenchus okinawaensis]CAG9117321.1 unnamed protein product [Bursaphelenchus okinawaensis]